MSDIDRVFINYIYNTTDYIYIYLTKNKIQGWNNEINLLLLNTIK